MLTPVAVTAEQALKGNYDAELVRIEARLLDRVLSSAQQILVLQAGRWVFNAQMEDSEVTLDSVPDGSLVQLTGIYSVQLDENRNARDTPQA